MMMMTTMIPMMMTTTIPMMMMANDDEKIELRSPTGHASMIWTDLSHFEVLFGETFHFLSFNKWTSNCSFITSIHNKTYTWWATWHQIRIIHKTLTGHGHFNNVTHLEMCAYKRFWRRSIIHYFRFVTLVVCLPFIVIIIIASLYHGGTLVVVILYSILR